MIVFNDRYNATTATSDYTYDGTASSDVTFVSAGLEQYVSETTFNEALEILSLVQLARIANAQAAREYLRLGLFLAINPPKLIEFFVRRYWMKILRCNRHGIGLRIKIDR